MTKDRKALAIIGGSGLSCLDGFVVEKSETVDTCYGTTSGRVSTGSFHRCPLHFLPRHGEDHTVAPHLINYRANIRALYDQGVSTIVAVNAVGGIGEQMGPNTLAVPDQIIDYSYGREHTFLDGIDQDLDHIDFTHPYTELLRQELLQAAESASVPVVAGGTYACTQGPRLETAAEIERLRRDGCHLVGMTAMPEAALARELGMDYASINLVVNWGAGLSEEPITMGDIRDVLSTGMENVRSVLAAWVSARAR